MKYNFLLGKINLILICIGFLISINAHASDIEIRLETIDSSIVGSQRYIKLNTLISNKGKTSIKMIFGYEGTRMFHASLNTYLKLNIEGPIDMDKIFHPIIGLLGVNQPLPFLEIKPGETISLKAYWEEFGICNPGRYKIQAEYRGDKAPKGYYKEIISSEVHEIEIAEPKGIDKSVYDDFFQIFYYSKNHPIEKNWCNFYLDRGKEFSWILDKYPTSTYSAWIIFRSLNEPEGWEPEKMKMLIAKNLYPLMNDVPDPNSPNGWRPITRKEAKEWEITSAEQILANHPDFPYARRLRLVIAIDTIALGNKEKGIKLLQEIAQDRDTKEGQWASKFVSLWN